MASSILALDQSGLPHKWLDLETAVFYYAKGLVSWDMGDIVKPCTAIESVAIATQNP